MTWSYVVRPPPPEKKYFDGFTVGSEISPLYIEGFIVGRKMEPVAANACTAGVTTVFSMKGYFYKQVDMGESPPVVYNDFFKKAERVMQYPALTPPYGIGPVLGEKAAYIIAYIKDTDTGVPVDLQLLKFKFPDATEELVVEKFTGEFNIQNLKCLAGRGLVYGTSNVFVVLDWGKLTIEGEDRDSALVFYENLETGTKKFLYFPDRKPVGLQPYYDASGELAGFVYGLRDDTYYRFISLTGSEREVEAPYPVKKGPFYDHYLGAYWWFHGYDDSKNALIMYKCSNLLAGECEEVQLKGRISLPDGGYVEPSKVWVDWMAAVMLGDEIYYVFRWRAAPPGGPPKFVTIVKPGSVGDLYDHTPVVDIATLEYQVTADVKVECYSGGKPEYCRFVPVSPATAGYETEPELYTGQEGGGGGGG